MATTTTTDTSTSSTAPSVPKTHKACIFDKPGEVSVKIQDVETPEPGPGQVLVRLTHSGVCHSDFGIMTNSWKHLPYPTQAGQVGGHEGVGEIVKMGSGTEEATVKVGDRVGIKWVSKACLNCGPCLAGADGCCYNQNISGYYTPGTFQQYALGPANYVTPIPSAIPSDVAAPMLCGGVTVYAAFQKSRAQAGDWIVISGAGGGLGHLACQIGGKGMGFRILGIDMGDKEKFIKDCGAEAFIALNDFERGPEGDKAIAEAVKKVTGGGASAVVVCTAANAAYAQALQFLKFNGTLVVVGIPEGDPVAIAGANPQLIIANQWNIVGSAVGNRREAVETLDMAARGIVTTHFTTHKMDELQSIFENMEKGQIKGRCVLALE